VSRSNHKRLHLGLAGLEFQKQQFVQVIVGSKSSSSANQLAKALLHFLPFFRPIL
jgi:hypothetical protein